MRNVLPANWVNNIKGAVKNNAAKSKRIREGKYGISSVGFYADNAKIAMEKNYGISADIIDEFLHSPTDHYKESFYENVPVEKFVEIRASMFWLKNVSEYSGELKDHFIGENKARIALFEFSQERNDQEKSQGWVYFDGCVFKQDGENTLVISPSFDNEKKSVNWEFKAFDIEMPTDVFTEMSSKQRAALLSNSLGMVGDIDQCVDYALKKDNSPRSSMVM